MDADSEFRLQIEDREKNVLRIVENRPKVWYTKYLIRESILNKYRPQRKD